MTSRRQVLIVEDNAINRELLCNILAEEYETLEAENGEEALAILRERKDEIALVLLDVIMPVMDGFEATKIIRDMEKEVHCRHIPIYAVTANTAMEDCNAAFEAGVDGIFAKPVHFQEFFETLANDGIVKKA